MVSFHGTVGRSSAIAATVLLAGCGLSEDAPTEFGHIDLADYPGQLERDFNAHSDQARLVFIVGPT
jgi:hypothetical protein